MTTDIKQPRVFEFERYGGTQSLTQRVITEYVDSKHLQEIMNCDCRAGKVLAEFTSKDGVKFVVGGAQ